VTLLVKPNRGRGFTSYLNGSGDLLFNGLPGLSNDSLTRQVERRHHTRLCLRLNCSWTKQGFLEAWHMYLADHAVKAHFISHLDESKG
jgi:hypothetical protein